MNAKSRRQLLAALLFGVLMAGLVWSFQEMRAAQAALAVSRAQWGQCEELADQIRELQQRPTVAALEETSITTLATLVEDVAVRSAIPRQAIVRIEPQAARRLAETDYKEQATFVELRGVSLPQLVQLMHTLLSEQSELDIGSLRLTAPRHEAEGGRGPDEVWLAELTLTYLIFAPRGGG